MPKRTIEDTLRKIKKKPDSYLRCNKTGIIDTALKWVEAEREGIIRIERLFMLEEVKLIQYENGQWEWVNLYNY